MLIKLYKEKKNHFFAGVHTKSKIVAYYP